MKNDDEIFMARFNNQLNLEPNPEWVGKRKEEFPWLETAWALVATMLLALYWTELRFGYLTFVSDLSQHFAGVPLRWIFVALAGGYGLVTWLGPKILREL